jgi:hypothetical protein
MSDHDFFDAPDRTIRRSELRVGEPPAPSAVFPAKHPEVGPLSVWALTCNRGSIGEVVDVRLAIDVILHDDFHVDRPA